MLFEIQKKERIEISGTNAIAASSGEMNFMKTGSKKTNSSQDTTSFQDIFFTSVRLYNSFFRNSLF